MNTCTNCGKPVAEAALFCSACGSKQRSRVIESSESQPAAERQHGAHILTSETHSDERKPARSSSFSLLRDFLAFRVMMSPLLLKLAYVLGVVALIVVGVDSITAYISAPRGATTTCNDFGYCTTTSNALPIGILVLTVGNLIWRLLCERVIVFFSIHERLRRIEQNTGTDRGW